MSLIRYNEHQLDVVKVHRFEQEPVWSNDGTTYLWTHFTLHCRCIFNRVATNINGSEAAVSLPILRQDLLEPGGKLIFAVNGQTVLESPVKLGGVDARCDANSGPHPIRCDIVEVHGTKTFVVDYAIETWVYDFGNTFPSCLISNRYEVTESFDRHFYSTRTYNGVAVFRKDALEKAGLVPDDFRGSLVPPNPENFHRIGGTFRTDSDGVRLYWSVTDEEQSVTLNGTGITQIKGTYRTGYDWTSIMNGLPIASDSVKVQVWGNRFSSKQSLVNAAVAVAANCGINVGNGGEPFPWYNAGAVVALEENYAEFFAEFSPPAGPLGFAVHSIDRLKVPQNLSGPHGEFGRVDGGKQAEKIYRGTARKRLAPLPLGATGIKPIKPVDPGVALEVQ